MMSHPSMAKCAVAALLPLLLAACFFIPGKFVSNFDVRKNGQFSFTYKGEIIAFSSNKMLNDIDKGASKQEESFTPSCRDEDSGEERKCSAAETAEQKKEWDAAAPERAKARAEKEKEQAEMMAVMIGFNPDDPKSVEAFINRLSKQKGWNSVAHKGAGVFEVDYAISGTLDRDFSFPNIPDIAMANPMVVARARKDGSIEIEAPGFGENGDTRGGNLMAAIAQKEYGGKDEPNPLTVQTDGQFTITTDAELLTNNTDDGPTAVAQGKRLHWTVNAQSKKRPAALLKLGS